MTTETPNDSVPTPAPMEPPNRQAMAAEEQLALAEVRLNLALIRYEIQAKRGEAESAKQGRVRL